LKTKICTKCKQEKLEQDFNKDTRNSPTGRRARCKICENYYERKRRKEFRLRNLEYTKKKEFEHNIKNKYGLTVEDWNLFFNKQNGCCIICGKHQSFFDKRLGVEHNHKTGKVRGLACRTCNHLIDVCETKFYGHKEKIVSYLEEHNG
jgi:hypothetical protein